MIIERSSLGLFGPNCIKRVSLYSFLYSGECSFHNQTVYTNNSYIPSYQKFFHEKPSERCHQARVFMLGKTGTNELRFSDNTSDFLEPGSGGKAVAKWDTPRPSHLLVGRDVTKAGTAARPRGEGNPRG